MLRRKWPKKKLIIYGWNTVVRPDCFNIYNFGDKLIPYIDKTLAVLDQTGGVQDYQKYLLGIKQQMSSNVVNMEGVDNLVGFLDDIDVRRKVDWKSIFPDIVQIVNELKEEQNV